MSLPIRVRPEAEQDIAEAFDWYESQVDGLGRRFLRDLDRVFERISGHPSIHAIVYRGIRQTLVGRFPFLVCYVNHTDEVEIVAVMHAHRDPSSWQSRAE